VICQPHSRLGEETNSDHSSIKSNVLESPRLKGKSCSTGGRSEKGRAEWPRESLPVEKGNRKNSLLFADLRRWGREGLTGLSILPEWPLCVEERQGWTSSGDDRRSNFL